MTRVGRFCILARGKLKPLYFWMMNKFEKVLSV
jgi:hypothetical protein